jgi:hypothetical protein
LISFANLFFQNPTEKKLKSKIALYLIENYICTKSEDMKNLFFVLIAALTIGLTSCSKDRRINKKLEGSWNVTVYENVVMPSGSSLSLTFNKGSNGSGTGTSAGTGYFILSNFTFIYDIVDEKMTMTHGTSVDKYTISDYSSSEITFITLQGKKIVMQAQ